MKLTPLILNGLSRFSYFSGQLHIFKVDAANMLIVKLLYDRRQLVNKIALFYLSEKSMENLKPQKLEFNAVVNGRSLPLWHYKRVPAGMRPATRKDIYLGRPFLYKVRIGPDAGDYYTDYVRSSTVDAVLQMLDRGLPVYVKDVL